MFYQARRGFIAGRGAFDASVGGVTPASFTFGAGASSFSIQAVSPYTFSGTFNTGSSDLALVHLVNVNDFASGVITSVSVAGNAATVIKGINNAAEETVLAYVAAGTQTTATVSIAFTGTLLVCSSTGKVVTTTATPYSTGASGAGQGGGVATPMTFAATTGSGGIPANGVGVGVYGDFFASGRTISGITPNQSQVVNDVFSNGQNMGVGYSTTSGASSGVIIAGTTGVFPSWAIASWSP